MIRLRDLQALERRLLNSLDAQNARLNAHHDRQRRLEEENEALRGDIKQLWANVQAGQADAAGALDQLRSDLESVKLTAELAASVLWAEKRGEREDAAQVRLRQLQADLEAARRIQLREGPAEHAARKSGCGNPECSCFDRDPDGLEVL